jgi:hypothetical protein
LAELSDFPQKASDITHFKDLVLVVHPGFFRRTHASSLVLKSHVQSTSFSKQKLLNTTKTMVSGFYQHDHKGLFYPASLVDFYAAEQRRWTNVVGDEHDGSRETNSSAPAQQDGA